MSAYGRLHEANLCFDPIGIAYKHDIGRSRLRYGKLLDFPRFWDLPRYNTF